MLKELSVIIPANGFSTVMDRRYRVMSGAIWCCGC